MKRVLIVLLVLLLVGCSRTEPAPAEPRPAPLKEQQESVVLEPQQVPETGVVPAPDPAPEAETPSASAQNPTPAPKVPAKPVSPQEPAADWAAVAGKRLAAITEQEMFNVLVWEENDSRTDIGIHKGVNDWNVAFVNQGMSAFSWTEASSDDWMTAVMEDRIGTQLSFWDVEGEDGMSFTCCEKSDIVCITDPTKISYLRAVETQESGSLYELLRMVAEDAVSREILYVTADGALSPQEAAGRMAEKIAENYRSVPEWVVWKPDSVRAERAEIFDIYRGTPEEFCFNLGLAVKVDDAAALQTAYWQAGAGLSEADEEGFYGWSRQVQVRKDEEGRWAVLDMGTGGYLVRPECPEEKPQAAWLVEMFCLTEGESHDRAIPGQILSLPPDQMETLPTVLDQLTEAESRELCAILGGLLKEGVTSEYTADTLKPLLGDYGDWLDA